MPQNRAPSSRRQDNRADRGPVVDLEVIRGELDEAPSMPPSPRGGPRWLKATEQAWERFWSDRVSRMSHPEGADSEVLYEWLVATDDWHRVVRELRQSGVVAEGSQGQPVLHPLVKERHKLEGRLHKLRQELGMTPKARNNLGIAAAQAGLSAAELNQRIAEMGDEDELDDGGVEVVEIDGETWEEA